MNLLLKRCFCLFVAVGLCFYGPLARPLAAPRQRVSAKKISRFFESRRQFGNKFTAKRCGAIKHKVQGIPHRPDNQI